MTNHRHRCENYWANPRVCPYYKLTDDGLHCKQDIGPGICIIEENKINIFKDE